MKTLFTLLLLTSSLAAQVTISIGDITVPTEVAVAVNTWRKAHVKKTTELLVSVNASTTSISLKDTAGISIGDHFMIDAEEFIVTGVGTASRGAVQTTAASHTAGTPVRVLEWATNVALAKQWIKGGIIQILRSVPSSTISTAQTAIATQQAAIVAAEAAAVQ